MVIIHMVISTDYAYPFSQYHAKLIAVGHIAAVVAAVMASNNVHCC